MKSTLKLKRSASASRRSKPHRSGFVKAKKNLRPAEEDLLPLEHTEEFHQYHCVTSSMKRNKKFIKKIMARLCFNGLAFVRQDREFRVLLSYKRFLIIRLSVLRNVGGQMAVFHVMKSLRCRFITFPTIDLNLYKEKQMKRRIHIFCRETQLFHPPSCPSLRKSRETGIEGCIHGYLTINGV